ncbi:hypothetical protein [Halogranum amylolyticum]|uniref:hypothetical protein n=1 Tax=Halogranum amylolyticum TaxID=660520 RepID=UPI000AA9647E|nr:hypothetical protein [Halogranum amylolyticum]
MPIDRTSPSGGWRDVARELCADGGVDHEGGGDSRSSFEPCPDCGRLPGVDGSDLCCEVHLARLERASCPESGSDSDSSASTP